MRRGQREPPSETQARRRRNLGGCLVIALLVTVAYLPAMTGGYVWDDDSYVTANPTLTEPQGLRRIWLEPGATPQYYPLVFSSFWVERRLWQLHPAGYHIVNVALHIVNALLLWLFLARIGFPLAWVAAALFAVHPLQVESVAWITERKNVLSGCFYLLAAIAYVPVLDAESGRRTAAGARGGTVVRSWTTALLCYVLALLSKSVTATLPIALLLLAWWHRGRVTRRDLILLTPFMAVGAASGLFTSWLERNHVGALGASWSFTFGERLVIAGKNVWFYAAKVLWPHPLIFFYPRWQPHGYPPWHLAAPFGVIALVLLLWRYRSHIGRGPLAAALFFLVTLAPALGFVDFYPMRYSFAADHFSYLANIGVILGVLGASAAGARLLRSPGAPRWMRSGLLGAGPALGGIIVLLLAALSWQRSAVFRDEETLWRDTIEKNPAATSARVNLGTLLAKRGAKREALLLYQTALAAEPEAADILTNIGRVYEALRQDADAEAAYRAALRIEPGNSLARGGLTSVLLARGKTFAERGARDKAADLFRQIIRIDPSNAAARYNLGMVMDGMGDLAGATKLYREALRIDPAFAEAHNNLGVDLALLGEREAAASRFREALRLRPGYREAAVNLQALESAPRPGPRGPGDSHAP